MRGDEKGWEEIIFVLVSGLDHNYNLMTVYEGANIRVLVCLFIDYHNSAHFDSIEKIPNRG